MNEQVVLIQQYEDTDDKEGGEGRGEYQEEEEEEV